MDGNINQKTGQEQVLYDTASFDNQEPPKVGFLKKKIVSLVIGILVVASLAFLFFIFILPRITSQKNKKIVLSYWGVWEDSSVYASVFQEFEKNHPNVTIKYERQDIKSLGKYVERLKTRIDNGTGPDIFRFHNSWVVQLKNFLLPLPADVVAGGELETAYYSIVQKDLKKGGAYYGIPLGIDTLALFVNNSLFKAAGASPPTTWNDLLNIAAHLTVKNSESGKIETSGVALGTFDNIAHAADLISLLLVQNGADLKDIGGQSRKNAEQALEYYTFFAKGDGKVWDETQDNSKLAFAKGTLAMYFGYSWDAHEIKAINPSLDFSVVPVPHVPGGRGDTIASYWVEGISAKTKYSKEAFDLLKFLAKRETLEKLYTEQAKTRLFGEPYPRRDMADLLKSNPTLYPFVQQAQNAVSTPFSSDTYDDALNSALGAYLGNAIRSILQGTSVESAVDTLSSGTKQVLGKYGP